MTKKVFHRAEKLKKELKPITLFYVQPGRYPLAPHHAVERPFRLPGGKQVASIATLAAFGMLLVSIWETRPQGGAVVSVEWLLLFGWAIVGLIIWFPLKKYATASAMLTAGI